ncbi:hypothetical protein MUK42_12396, partial [Musa troglodytarum]
SHEELIYSWQIGPWCERSHELVSGISSHKEDMSFSHLQDSSTIGLWSSNKRPRHKSPGKKPTNPCAWLKDHHPCCPFLEHLILTIESTLKENDGFDEGLHIIGGTDMSDDGMAFRDEKSDGQTVFWAMQTSSSSDKSRNKVQKFTVFSANTCTIIDTKRQ